MAPVYDEIAAETPTASAQFAKVDCEIQKNSMVNLCTKYGAKGFPTLKAFLGSADWEYKGPRSKAGLSDLIARLSAPDVQELKSMAELEAAQEAAAPTPVFFFGGPSGEEAHRAFVNIARTLKHRDTFYVSSDPTVLKGVGGATSPTQAVARLERGEQARLMPVSATDPDFSGTAILAFVEAERTPTFSLIGADNFYDLSTTGKPLVMLFAEPSIPDAAGLTVADSEVSGSTPQALRSLARDEELRSHFVFGLLDAKDNAEHVTTTYNMEGPIGSKGRLIILMREKGRSYRQFAVSPPEDTRDGAAMRDYLVRVTKREVPFEYEGMWGAPERWWRVAKGYVPQLAMLDGAPRFSLISIPAVILLLLVIRLVVWNPVHDAYEEERKVRAAQKRK